MTQKERLVELLDNMPSVTDITIDEEGNIIPNRLLDTTEGVADYLLNNGVIVPPCKVGDTVYVISQFADDNVHTGVVDRMCIDEEGNEIIIVGDDWFVDDIGVCKSPSDFGKTVFLTHEEAEQALKERGNNV